MAKALWRTKYVAPEKKYTCPGNEIEEEWELLVNDKGIKEPVKVGEINVRDAINSHRDSVDLQILIARYNAGDHEALNKRAAQYFDATSMPKTLAEAYKMSENGKQLFEKLPIQIKEEFGQDYGQFLDAVGSNKFNDIFSKYLQPAAAAAPVKEVKDEQKPE